MPPPEGRTEEGVEAWATRAPNSVKSASETLNRLNQLNSLVGEYKASLISATDYLLRGRESFGAERALLPTTANNEGDRERIRGRAIFLAQLPDKLRGRREEYQLSSGEIRIRRIPLFDQERATLEQERKNAERDIYHWYRKEFPGVVNLLHSYLDSQFSEAEITPLVASAISHYVSMEGGLGKAYRYSVQDQIGSVRFRTSRIEQAQLKALTDLLFKRSTFFSSLEKGKTVSFEGVGNPIKEPQDQDKTVETIIERAQLAAEKQEAIQSLDQTVALKKLKDWVTETADKARRKGLKIFLTPFYKQILERGEFISRKKNGVGGVIYCGPPGTGKTEMHRAENAALGFDTKVLNIHYYIGFAELMAEKAIAVAKNHGGDLAKGLSEVVNQLKGQTPEEFSRNCHSLFNQLLKEGKLGPDAEFGDFVSHFISSEALKTQAESGDFSNMDWSKVREEFINTTQARLLRTALPGAYQESVDEVVLGEILGAIEESKRPGGKRIRVVLDEIDKAGPNSLGGLLSFLAKSPGEVFEYGGRQFVIPKWFKVGATSNEMTLREDLKSRFHAEMVHMPPAKDQLMIAAVHLSDGEGNILLSPDEQYQLAAFFVYALPRLNDILRNYDFPPYSNRDVQRLCGDLVDVGRLERTTTSVSEAIRNMVIREKILTRIDPETRAVISAEEDIDGCFYALHSFIADQVRDLREQKEARTIDNPLLAKEVARGTGAIPGLPRQRSADQPLLKIIVGLEEEVDPTHKPRLYPCNLTSEETAVVLSQLPNFGIQRANAGPGLERIKLPIGLVLSSQREGNGLVLRLESVPAAHGLLPQLKTRQLFGQRIGVDGRITAASCSGDVVGILESTANDKSAVRIADLGDGGYSSRRLWAEKVAGKQDEEQPALTVSRNSKVEIDATGSLISILDRENSQLVIYGRKSLAPWRTLKGVSDMTVSPDGRLMLVQRKDQSGKAVTVVYSTLLLSEEQILPGDGWTFAMDNLLFQVNESGGQKQVKNQAILITN